MTGRVTEIWRHPVKGHGREALETVTLEAGKALPWDRHWAVAHEASTADGSVWERCVNFQRGAKAPKLAAVAAQFDEGAGLLTLTHPELDPLTINPDEAPEALVAWSLPLAPEGRAKPARLVQAKTQAMTDSDWPSISILNHSSRRALSQRAGMDLDARRFRGNLWFDGLAPWEEFDWLDRRIRIGDAVFEVRERIERCLHTHDNPETGKRDGNTLTALEEGWNHRDFGVFAAVVQGGAFRVGDQIEVL